MMENTLMLLMRSYLSIRNFNLAALIILVVIGISSYCFASDKFTAIVYHDLTRNAVEKDDIPSDEFIRQLDFFKVSGYQPISIKDLQEAARGKKTLPDKAILFTFDDAYISFYRVAYPALKLFNYPAVLAVVTSWIEGNPPELYGKKQLMNWEQIKEVADSGLVTIASHSDNLHVFLRSNPQGNVEPAPFTFIYDPQTKKYETDEHFRERIRSDLARSQRTLEQKLGLKSIVLTWPFGAYNRIGLKEAQQLGFQIFLTLENGLADVKHLDQVARYYAYPLLFWVPEFKEERKHGFEPKTPIRGVQIDLDKIVEPDSEEESDQNLGKCLDRLVSLGVNTVFIQGFCDIKGSGTVSSLYFANSVLPVKRDFLSHAVNRIKSRGMKAYDWMPALSFELPDKKKTEELGVREFMHGKIRRTSDSYRRLSPFDPRSLEVVRAIYRDLAANVDFDGVLFQDDAFLTDEEDFHPSAAAAFQKATGSELTAALVKTDQIKKKWIQLKTETLNIFIKELIKTIHIYRPTAEIARNIYSEAVTNPASQEWFAQNLESYLQNYEYTVIMAYPQMEKIGGRGKIKKWLEELVTKVKGYNGNNKVIFKVQAFDWSKNRWIDEKLLEGEISYLLSLGARHVAYYPDGVTEDKPKRKDIGGVISGQESVRVP